MLTRLREAGDLSAFAEEKRVRTIALITDYGTGDYYTGAVKGVIASIAPDARVVDISHEIEPQNVAQGAFVLWQAWPWFPPGTVYLAVVDPGVGTSRRVLVGKFSDRYLVAPDNGLITWVHHEFAAQALHSAEDGRYFLPHVSLTFQGRDIMAPVAAHLVLGVEPAAFGPAISEIIRLSITLRAEADGDRVCGQVIYVDRFGNLITNIHRDQLTDAAGQFRLCGVMVGGVDLGPPRNAFADVRAGEPLAYLGSSDFVEIGVNQGSAARRFTPSPEVIIVFSPSR